ncbi:MAG: helix-turn-helix transcriptional regulator [Acidobacteria bacterium]|nr:helix-turn-helix transcriptional regulator [Acidobacteriota bacterium]
MKRRESNPCQISGLLEILTRPWTMHILWSLSRNGPQRFSVLRRQIEGISSRVLTERLRTLEERGFIYRKYEPTIPPCVTYGITNRMRDIEKVLGELDRIAKGWNAEETAASPSPPDPAEPSVT